MKKKKKDWKVLDEIQVVLSKFAPMMDEKDKARVNALINLCAEATQKERVSRDRNIDYIREKRKVDPQYCRNYIANKESARKEALEWLNAGRPETKNVEYFSTLAKLYGLQKEFRKLGII